MSASFRVTVPLEMSLLKVFIVQKYWKLYAYLFVLYTIFSLFTFFSISLILLSWFLASSLNAFSGIASLIVIFLVLGFKTSKASACFDLDLICGY